MLIRYKAELLTGRLSMRKSIERILFISCLSVIFLFFASPVLCRVIPVGSTENLKSIKEAIQLAQPGDTIMVNPGIYREGKLVIDKAIVFLGKGKPVLDGELKNEILTLSGKHIVVKGFCLQNSGISSMNDYAAIKCIDASDVILEGNEIINSHFAIHVSNSTRVEVKKNSITGHSKNEQNTGNGIHFWKCNHILIDGNQINGHRDGIYLEFVTESSIQYNISTKNIRYGLHFMFSHNDSYSNNEFRNNGAGVAVMYSRNVTMIQNLFENNWGASAYGILLKDISDSKIQQNRFIKNTVGIFMEGSSRIMMEKNLFKDNGWAFKVQASCNDNQFQFNNFVGNSFDVATNGTMMLNKFTCNYWDRYEGYDRNRDGYGDISYRPVNLYSLIVEQNPVSLILLRSILITILDKAEKAIPSITPEFLVDDKPKMLPNTL